jgi:AAA domain
VTNVNAAEEPRKPDGVLTLDLENFPAALEPLTKLKQWVTWKWELTPKGKWTKKPFWGRHPKYPAAVTDPRVRSTFSAASFNLEKHEKGTDGIGFVMLGSGMAAFDIDNCRDPTSGEIAPIALELVERANTYAEVTVSGTGLRIIGYGESWSMHTKRSVPDSDVSIELYRNCERFITISGHQIEGTPDTLANIDALLNETVERFGGVAEPTAKLMVEEIPANDNGLCYIEAFLERDQTQPLLNLVREGIPLDDIDPDRSKQFFRAVKWMKDLKFSVATIVNLFRRYPEGIAEKYEGRLEQETLRVYGKPDSKPDPQKGRHHDNDDDDYGETSQGVMPKPSERDEDAPRKYPREGMEGSDDELAVPLAKKEMIDSSEEFTRDFVPPDYLLDGVCLKGFMYAMTAPTGSGKTALLMRLAMCVAEGREFSGREVTKGKVLYLAGENPDDVRMRWLAMAEHMAFDADTIEVFFIAGVYDIDRRMKKVVKQLVEKMGDVTLVVVDTGPAYFMGDNENDNVEMINHAKILRSLVNLPGNPTVIAAMHPTKNAARDSLLPRGGGAFLNEIDGNLTAWKDDMTVTLHWAGKHRGVNFDPMNFELSSVTARKLKDSRGRSIPTVIMNELSADEVVKRIRDKEEGTGNILILLCDGRKQPTSTADIADEIGWMTKNADGKTIPNKRKAQTAIDKLKADKLVDTVWNGVQITPKGRKYVEENFPQIKGAE